MNGTRRLFDSAGSMSHRSTEQYRDAETELRPDVEQLIQWLLANRPAEDPRMCLEHGDYRLDNPAELAQTDGIAT
jgi:aminoglycoside phosphotransferase (APT) family kinase protein